MKVRLLIGSASATLALLGLAAPPAPAQASAASASEVALAPAVMDIDQTLSDRAQLTTIAFDGLAFLTGSLGSDSFFPPGKVADFWGFQYLRDNDPSGMGHNTDFLTRASLNMLQILTPAQRSDLIDLARAQVEAIDAYAYDRFTLMAGFRRLLSGRLPKGTTHLKGSAVRAYSASLYAQDSAMSIERARVMGSILHDLSAPQRASLDGLVGKGMTSWPVVPEPDDLKGLGHSEKVAVMTYGGDLFSWYAGDLAADIYFCPERQGTYFGSFYLKDAKAVGNPDYTIGTDITGKMGDAFLAALDPVQRARITALVDIQRPWLESIVTTRASVSAELRKAIDGQAIDPAKVAGLMRTYGRLDGAIATQYAKAFAAIGPTLTPTQRATLEALRTELVGELEPTGAYLYSEPIPMPHLESTRFLFGR